MSEKHTPGPWCISSDDEGAYVVDELGITLVATAPHNEGASGRAEADANARLISAAPELLAACEAALRELPHEKDVRSQLILAIAKAKGGA